MKTGHSIRVKNGLMQVFRYALLIGLILSQSLLASPPPRERLLLDFNWKFRMGDNFGLGEELDKSGVSSGPAAARFHDANWRTVNLPHDWAVELPFDSTADRGHGYKPIGPGFPANSVGWYRRAFALPAADSGRRLWIEFDGVYRDARVFLNGFLLTHHECGYHTFRCEITDVAKYGGDNILAVRVDASQFEGWFYEGAGIYRHVWLVKTSPLSIEPDGVFVYTMFPNNAPGAIAGLAVSAQLSNKGSWFARTIVNWSVRNPDGEVVSSKQWSRILAPGERTTAAETDSISSPILWSPESPRLYSLITTVKSGDDTVDSVETQFGFRSTEFDPGKGFLLNGKPYPIHGTCNHQDHAGVGAAMPDALQYFRIKKLKEMGCNAIRTSHNAPTPELLDACDRLGMLVMDETRHFGSDDESRTYLADQVRRDRNHPSVFIWSIANEEVRQREPEAARIARTMQDVVHRLDPTRRCTAAMNGWSSAALDGISIPIDVQGFNYFHIGDMDAFHKSNLSKSCIGTEEASAFSTRGIYENTSTYKSAYDDNKPGYGSTAQEWVSYFAARPWANGSFAWTGFDYRGEPSPFRWPNISSEFGIIDMCGFPKDAFYGYQSWWSDKPMIHLLPHWNWDAKQGRTIDVRCYSNCEEVELFLNGTSLGKKQMARNSDLRWSVPYAPGKLEAKGMKGGKVIAEDNVETTGAPAGILLTADRTSINADGEDLSMVTVAVVDAAGRIVPTAGNHVTFELTGPGKIIGVGNGDPICHEPDVYFPTPVTRTVALDKWRMHEVPSPQDRPEAAENYDDGQWSTVDVRGEDSQLGEEKSGVYRTHINLTREDLESDDITIRFGMIDDDGWVYVNGKPAGEAHDWSEEQIFSIGKLLRVGENTVAIAVKNNRGPGGLNKGCGIELTKTQKPSPWQRSAFNGLAQVIVQSGKTAGAITLTARADGLKEGKLEIRAAAKGLRARME